MSNNYWDSLNKTRLSRRRTLALGAGASAAAAFLAACGSDSGGGTTTPEEASSLISKPIDTTSQAKAGGVMKWYILADVPNLDAALASAPLNNVYPLAYKTLLNEKPGKQTFTDFEPIADLAESWEWSTDLLQLTLKLRKDVKWHNKAPVNGRAFDSSDVVASWERFAAKAGARGDLANSANPAAPVLSFTATDANTVQIKLKEPLAYLLSHLAFNLSSGVAIMPKETDNGFDPRREMIGTGPFTLHEYTPSVGFNFRKNPDYFEKGMPYFDELQMPIVLEYAQALAQLKAGNMYTYPVRPEDILATKRDVPNIGIYSQLSPTFNVHKTTFGWQPAGGSVFRDERVRQAFSMSLDRDLYLDTFFNVESFERDGLPVDTYWNTHIGPIAPWWVDPRSSAFGENGKYFAYNIAEAKKLLAAAGFANGLETDYSQIAGTQLGATHPKIVEVQSGMALEAGFRTKANVVDYTTVYIPKYRDSGGNFEGIAYKGGSPSAFDALQVTSWEYYSRAGNNFLGFDAEGKGNNAGDPYVDQQIEKGRGERDNAKRQAIVADLQKHLAKKMYAVPIPGIASGFTAAWPVLGNFGMVQTTLNKRDPMYWWLDTTKAPLSQS